MKRDLTKTIIAVIASLYFLWCAYDPYQWRLIDGVNLVIHEAGHVVFMPFGEFVMIAGGSLLQIIMPLAFVVYFYRTEKPYSAALVLFWVGESILNVSVYASDSLAMQLPLLGGQDSIHDWNYMLERLGILTHTAAVGGSLRMIGTLVILAAVVWSLTLALKRSDDSLADDLTS